MIKDEIFTFRDFTKESNFKMVEILSTEEKTLFGIYQDITKCYKTDELKLKTTEEI